MNQLDFFRDTDLCAKYELNVWYDNTFPTQGLPEGLDGEDKVAVIFDGRKEPCPYHYTSSSWIWSKYPKDVSLGNTIMKFRILKRALHGST